MYPWYFDLTFNHSWYFFDKLSAQWGPSITFWINIPWQYLLVQACSMLMDARHIVGWNHIYEFKQTNMVVNQSCWYVATIISTFSVNRNIYAAAIVVSSRGARSSSNSNQMALRWIAVTFKFCSMLMQSGLWSHQFGFQLSTAQYKGPESSPPEGGLESSPKLRWCNMQENKLNLFWFMQTYKYILPPFLRNVWPSLYTINCKNNLLGPLPLEARVPVRKDWILNLKAC